MTVERRVKINRNGILLLLNLGAILFSGTSFGKVHVYQNNQPGRYYPENNIKNFSENALEGKINLRNENSHS